MSLPCPECGQPTKVLETRLLKGYIDRVRRRRECQSCGRRFSTAATEREVTDRSRRVRDTTSSVAEAP
jgi:transcriptional regulator NrdR family protein